MLGKLHINEHNYDTAKTYFKAILDSNGYSLTPHIGHNFNIENEMNSESIFEVAFSVEPNQVLQMELQMGQLVLKQHKEPDH